jgi:hypothetical protein
MSERIVLSQRFEGTTQGYESRGAGASQRNYKLRTTCCE